ncbi:hypothetical protein [Maribellus sp. YY47]|uniref:hypothetical protein n=1 Tax=Maribellus sp. YY47 TaxID=2929486 RepID=UPI00200197A5|nr:hypothetical protein [Maribellus sp. YY47]MCK3686059.1 hypothetical protein [Maribellus sp. YY47]
MKKLLLFLFLLTVSVAKAQYFQTGQDPSSIKWRQINTENFQLIYPVYYESQAQLLGQKLEKVYAYASYSLKYRPKKISVILHTQTVNSNGLVAYAPKRSEFYTTPHQAIFPLDWLEQLAVHEFRHVVQIDKINSELPKIIKLLLGEQGTALVFGAYLPWWFIEGDAVVTETALSSYGRGRLPSFLMEHRALAVKNGIDSYDKAYLGSYKEYVPNHYNLGYYLVGNARERYGSELWEKVLQRVGDKPFSLTPFNSALRSETGLNKVELYQSVFDSLARVWKAEDALYKELASLKISKPSEKYSNYQYNHWLNDREMVSYKTSFDDIAAFVKIDMPGREEVLHRPGTIFDESVSYAGEWIVWSEQIPDLRWSHSGRSVIQLFNIKTKQKRSLKTEYKAFAPVLSFAHDKILVVEADFSSNYYLTVYDLVSGKMMSRYQTPENNYFLSPQWLNDNEAIVVLLTNHGKRLAKIDLEKKKFSILLDQDLGEIKQLRIRNNQLYFICGYSGKDALYSFDLATSKVEQLFEPRFGAAYPAISSTGEILLSDYTADGYRLIKPLDLQPQQIKQVEKEEYPLAGALAGQEMGIPDLSASDDTARYASENYSKAAHLFKFHSWAPVFVDPYSYEFQSGVSVMSQNKLGTAETVLGYRWNTGENNGDLYAHFIYKGWYPVIDVELSQGKRSSQYSQITEYTRNGQVVSRDTTVKSYDWTENNLSTTIQFPVNLTRGIYYRLLQPELGFDYTNYKTGVNAPDAFPGGTYKSFTYRMYYHQIRKSSYQDVLPDFGLILDGSYIHSPLGDNDLGSLLSGEGIMYLPGLKANHGLRLYGGGQKRINGDHFSYSDDIRFPRGWRRISTREMVVGNIDYKFPLLYPDLSIGGLSYIKRITASVFFDYAYMIRNYYSNGQVTGSFSQNISSCGVELLGDVNFLRFYAPVQIGGRVSYLPEIKHTNVALLLSVDFSSL